ncbi:MAG: hypothetical protein U9Q03_03695 [Patescibacteria group bacterium]|nr:hypothetical protein [Patescibacteria group bacterium]
MKHLSDLWAFLKDAVSFLFVGNLDDDFVLDLKDWDALNRPPTVRIPPRKKHVGETGPDWRPHCDHEPDSGAVCVTVSGFETTVIIPDDVKCCKECFESWLNLHATTCSVCGEPILTFKSVAEISPFSNPPFAHMRPMCCRYPSKYCGMWGPGRLISLHELHPDQISPGTRTIADHAMQKNPGEPWFEGWNAKMKPN